MSSQLSFAQSPDFLCVSGSRLYGCARYDDDGNILSDLDLRGFVLPPIDYHLGLKVFNETDFEGDHKVWNLRRFFDMLIKGNAQALECLFAPASHIQQITMLGRHVLNNRNLFIGKQYYKSITGFSYSEWHKVRGTKRVPVVKARDETQLLDAVRDKFKTLPKDKWDLVLETLYSEHEMKVVDAKGDVGEKRRAEYEKYGYSVTSAHHALRLLWQCIELLDEGVMTFPRPEAPFLSQVKRGEVALEVVESTYDTLSILAREAYEESELPERADVGKIDALYREIVYDFVRSYFNNEHYALLGGGS